MGTALAFALAVAVTLRAAPAAQAARHQPPILSVPYGAGRQPAGGRQGWPWASAPAGGRLGGMEWADAGGGKGSVEKAV
jgi:hypothetical protein